MNSLCSISGHGFRKTNAVVSPPPASVLYYPFWADTKDYAPPNNVSGISDGTLSNANIYYQSSIGYKAGKGSLFNSTGNAANYFDIPNNTYLASNGYTVAFWFRGGNTAGMIFKALNTSTSGYFYVYWNGSGLTLDNGTNWLPVYGMSNNVWYHFVWSVPPSGLAYVYINGGSVNGGQDLLYSATPNQAINLTPTGTRIFNDYNLTSGVGTNGYMNNFRLYNRPVTQTEITALFQE